MVQYLFLLQYVGMTSNKVKTPSLFKWWGESFTSPLDGNCQFLDGSTRCKWCGALIEKDVIDSYANSSDTFYYSVLNQCLACGWHIEATGRWIRAIQKSEYVGFRSILREFEINDEAVALNELGTHLKVKFSDVYELTPRRFEELIEDVFKNLGYRTHLTQKTRDGGADIFLLDGKNEKKAIVEVKRYASHRSVGVSLVRQLIGAQLLHNAPKSYLVTTSSFSRDAVIASSSPQLAKHKIEIDLWDAIKLLQALSCYNESVLPASSINPEIPLHKQISKKYCVKRRLLKPPYPNFWGKRVSYLA